MLHYFCSGICSWGTLPYFLGEPLVVNRFFDWVVVSTTILGDMGALAILPRCVAIHMPWFVTGGGKTSWWHV
ncbi:hypothetical protein EBZ35_02645 [bacterium]|nr:hypothetical protein [bacterium]